MRWTGWATCVFKFLIGKVEVVASRRKGQRSKTSAALDYLPYSQHEQLCKWLLTSGLSYKDIAKKVKAEFGFAISDYSIGQFYQNHVLGHLLTLRERAVNIAAGYLDAASKAPSQFTAAMMDALEAKAMQSCYDPNIPPRDLERFVGLVIRSQELRLRAEESRLKMRRLRLLERRQKKLESVLDVRSSLTSDEVAERCRLIFRTNGTHRETTSDYYDEKTVTSRLPSLPP